MGIGDWGLGIGDWGVGVGANFEPSFNVLLNLFIISGNIFLKNVDAIDNAKIDLFLLSTFFKVIIFSFEKF